MASSKRSGAPRRSNRAPPRPRAALPGKFLPPRPWCRRGRTSGRRSHASCRALVRGASSPASTSPPPPNAARDRRSAESSECCTDVPLVANRSRDLGRLGEEGSRWTRSPRLRAVQPRLQSTSAIPRVVTDPAANLQALLVTRLRLVVLSGRAQRLCEAVQRDREGEVVAGLAGESEPSSAAVRATSASELLLRLTTRTAET